MLTAEITGDSHPKKVVLVSDDADAENIMLQEGLENWEFTELAATLQSTSPDADGNLKLEIPPEDIGEVMDFIEGEFFGSEAHKKLDALREEAVTDAEAKLSEG